MRAVSVHEQEFLKQLPHIEAVIRQVGRRYRLAHEECNELGAQVKLKLVENDFLVFQRFQGRSSLRTYLTTVVTRIFLDERTKAWGKWRPSSEAKRLGPLAVAFERLLTRDKLSLDEAIAMLVSRDDTCDEALLLRLASLLPIRLPARRHVGEQELEGLPSAAPSSDHLVMEHEARSSMATARAALTSVVAALPAQDQLLLALRFRQGCRIADIARIVGQPQKPLYRRFETLLARLREELSRRGVSADQLQVAFDLGVEDEEPGSLGRIWDEVAVRRGDAHTRLDPVVG